MSENFRAAAFGVLATLMTSAAAFAAENGAASGEAVSAVTQEAVALVSDGVAAKAQNDKSCPRISIAPEADTRREGGARATLDGLARDCANLGAETIVKVALVGESERKKGGPAAVDAPLTIQIKDGDGREIETRRINLRVEMPEGVQKVSFRHVEENVSLPPPTADGYANWIIVVALDPSAEAAEPEVAAAEEQADQPEPAVRDGRSSRKSRFDRSRARAVKSARARAGRQRIVLQPQQAPQLQLRTPSAADLGPPQAQVQTYIPSGGQTRPAAPTRTAAPATAARAPAAQQARQPAPAAAPAASGSGSPWKRMADDFNARRAGARAPAQQPAARTRQPAPAGPRVAAQPTTTTDTN